ncbi:MAG: hypothetical protein SGPRY_005142 [Prymnesium sp.]
MASPPLAAWGLKLHRRGAKYTRKWLQLNLDPACPSLTYYNDQTMRRGTALDLKRVRSLSLRLDHVDALEMLIATTKGSTELYTFVLPVDYADEWRELLISAVPAAAVSAQLHRLSKQRPPVDESNQEPSVSADSIGSALRELDLPPQEDMPRQSYRENDTESIGVAPLPLIKRHCFASCTHSVHALSGAGFPLSKLDHSVNLVAPMPKDTLWAKLHRARSMKELVALNRAASDGNLLNERDLIYPSPGYTWRLPGPDVPFPSSSGCSWPTTDCSDESHTESEPSLSSRASRQSDCSSPKRGSTREEQAYGDSLNSELGAVAADEDGSRELNIDVQNAKQVSPGLESPSRSSDHEEVRARVLEELRAAALPRAFGPINLPRLELAVKDAIRHSLDEKDINTGIMALGNALNRRLRVARTKPLFANVSKKKLSDEIAVARGSSSLHPQLASLIEADALACEAELRKIAEEEAAAQAAQIREEERREELRRKREEEAAEEARRREEVQRRCEEEAAEEAKRREEARQRRLLEAAEEAKKREEARRRKELEAAEEAKRKELDRQRRDLEAAEEAKKKEEARRVKAAEEAKRKEEARKRRELKAAEEAKRKEEARRVQAAEEAKRKEEAQRRKELEAAEDTRRREEMRRAEARRIHDAKIAEDARKRLEAQKAEARRKRDALAAAEAAGRREEERKQANECPNETDDLACRSRAINQISRKQEEMARREQEDLEQRAKMLSTFGHKANQNNDIQRARALFIAASRLCNRDVDRISAANMALKLGELHTARTEYLSILEDGSPSESHLQVIQAKLMEVEHIQIEAASRVLLVIMLPFAPSASMVASKPMTPSRNRVHHEHKSRRMWI